MSEVDETATVGCLLGAAIGDAVGLPFEGLSRRRVQRFCAGRALNYRFFFGRGFCSDDTEHSCMVAQALLAARAAESEPSSFVAKFRRSLAWRLRFWLLGLPAGIGLATLRSLIKLWFDPLTRGEGVNSAGNGPAMRSAIIGVCLAHDPEAMKLAVRASTRLTHTDPRAEQGALAMALAASFAARRTVAPARESFPLAFEHMTATGCGDARELCGLIRRAAESARGGESTEAFAQSLGLNRGVSGFVMHTAPVALHAWFRHENDYEAAIAAAVNCGGDTDTVAAIVGAIVGARVGEAGIPARWRAGLWEWPRSSTWIVALGRRLAHSFSGSRRLPPLPLNPACLLLRNLLFMMVVLLHGFRRLLPPY